MRPPASIHQPLSDEIWVEVRAGAIVREIWIREVNDQRVRYESAKLRRARLGTRSIARRRFRGGGYLRVEGPAPAPAGYRARPAEIAVGQRWLRVEPAHAHRAQEYVVLAQWRTSQRPRARTRAKCKVVEPGHEYTAPVEIPAAKLRDPGRFRLIAEAGI